MLDIDVFFVTFFGMNKFCGNLLCFLLGLGVLAGGVALFCLLGGVKGVLFGVFLMLSGPLLCFAACVGWRKAADAENLFGRPLTWDDYLAGVAIPYAEVPLALGLRELKQLAGAPLADGCMKLSPEGSRARLELFAWTGEDTAAVEVRRCGDVDKNAPAAEADSAVIYTAESPGVSAAKAHEWFWYGVLCGQGRPLLHDTLWYICGKASAKLKNRGASAVLLCDRQRLRVYPARRLEDVRALLSSCGIK